MLALTIECLFLCLQESLLEELKAIDAQRAADARKPPPTPDARLVAEISALTEANAA